MSDTRGLQMKYFVLNPLKRNAYGRASLAALEAYENSIRSTNMPLAEDLRLWRAEIKAGLLLRDNTRGIER